MLTHDRVLGALGRVRDPELDEPITDLGFIHSVEIDGDAVTVALRVPTYYCAPNFTYMMLADAREALEDLPDVRHVRVAVVDHHASGELNAVAGAGGGFAETFPGETDEDDLSGLRGIFRGKAFYARTNRLCERLREEGRTPRDLAAMRLADLPDWPETDVFLERRSELGLDSSPEAPLLIAIDGRVIPPEEAEAHLRRARLFNTSLESNGEYCRSLLQFRYGLGSKGAASESRTSP